MTHDPARTPTPDFPRLTPANHRLTSPGDAVYNCIAWAVGETHRWWQPDIDWPVEVDPDTRSVEELVRVYQSVGFEPASGDEPLPGVELIVVYADPAGDYTHAARRLPSGKWTSKLGAMEDIEHDTPNDVAGGIYGDVVQFLKRPLPAPPVS